MSTIHLHRTTTSTPEQNLKGRALGLVLGTVGRRVLDRAFGNTIKAIEARNGKDHGTHH
jgi:hypothetical protein